MRVFQNGEISSLVSRASQPAAQPSPHPRCCAVTKADLMTIAALKLCLPSLPRLLSLRGPASIHGVSLPPPCPTRSLAASGRSLIESL